MSGMEEEDDEIVSQTQTQMPASADISTPTSRLEYWWLILFEHDVNLEKPFQIIVKHTLNGGGIPQSWYQGALNNNCRRLILKLKMLPGQKYSVFAKVEKG